MDFSISDGSRLELLNLAGVSMAKNKRIGDNARVGAVRERSQVFNPQNQTWTKRDAETGRFMDQKADADPFKGVRKEKKGP